MAQPTARLVFALRETASRLERSDVIYKWSHFAHCNCGHLAQTITRLPPRVIYEAALQRSGDWGEQAARLPAPDYGDRPALDEGAWSPEDLGACSVTGAPLGSILQQMYAAGLDETDVRHLEDLSDPQVLRRLGKSTTGLHHANRSNVVAYLRAWAELLENKLSPDELSQAVEELPVAAE